MSKPPQDGERQTSPTESETLPTGFALTLAKVLASMRYVFVLAVISTLVASFLVLIAGTIETYEMVVTVLGMREAEHAIPLRTQALEIVDNFLVSLVLVVLSFGFYQLMIASHLPLPGWLRIRTPAEMELKLIGVIVTVAAVSSLVQIVSWSGGTELLSFGLGVGAIIVALAAYLWAHAQGSHGGKPD